MKKFWFYLEPYTLLFTDNNTILVYNTLTNKALEFKNAKPVSEMVENLKVTENMYCIELTEKDLVDENLYLFVKEVKNSFSGDLVETSMCKRKPVIILPRLRLKDRIDYGFEDHYSGISVADYLFEISIYVNSECKQNCKYCTLFYKQMIHCTKTCSKEAFDMHLLVSLFNEINDFSLTCVNILGGDISLHSNLKEIVYFLNEKPFIKSYNFHYTNFKDFSNKNLFKHDRNIIKVLIDFTENVSKVRNVIEQIHKSDFNKEFSFCVQNEFEFEEAEKIIQSLQLDNVTITPLFSFNNYSFFKDYIFLNKEDILNSHLSKNDFFTKEVINTNNFGKITILSNGDVYS